MSSGAVCMEIRHCMIQLKKLELKMWRLKCKLEITRVLLASISGRNDWYARVHFFPNLVPVLAYKLVEQPLHSLLMF